MSRLSLLIASVLTLAVSATTQAVIVFHPDPVPTPPCYTAYETLNPYYQQQLFVLNHPYGGSCGYVTFNTGYNSIDISVNPCSVPTVNLFQSPCAPPAPLYFRKADLMPRPVTDDRTSAVPAEKGTILIIPKALLNRPLKSFQPPLRTRCNARLIAAIHRALSIRAQGPKSLGFFFLTQRSFAKKRLSLTRRLDSAEDNSYHYKESR